MRERFSIIKLIVLLPLLFSIACSGGIGETKDFGSPPTPGRCFCDPEGVETYLKWISEEYPDFTELRKIGSSENGKPIYVLEISNPPSFSGKKPAVLINAGIHGDEQLSSGVALKFIEDILKAYDYYLNPEEGIDAPVLEPDKIGYLVENFEIHIMPVVNPDGLGNGERLNSNYVDLNRNFGYNWHEDENNNGETPFDQSESAAVRDDFIENGYSLVINLHTAAYTGNIGIYAPWDAINSAEPQFVENYLPNYLLIKEIGGAYAETVFSENSYPFNYYFHYDEGGDWYLMNGSMADWAMGTSGAVSYTVELYGAQNFTTEDVDLMESTWMAHSAAMIELLKKAEDGSGGIVVDSDGSPVENAAISFDFTAPASRGFIPIEYSKLEGNSAADGSFRFLTDEGMYHIVISKPGRQTLELDVEVGASGLTSVEGGSYRFFPEYILPEL